MFKQIYKINPVLQKNIRQKAIRRIQYLKDQERQEREKAEQERREREKAEKRDKGEKKQNRRDESENEGTTENRRGDSRENTN